MQLLTAQVYEPDSPGSFRQCDTLGLVEWLSELGIITTIGLQKQCKEWCLEQQWSLEQAPDSTGVASTLSFFILDTRCADLDIKLVPPALPLKADFCKPGWKTTGVDAVEAHHNTL